MPSGRLLLSSILENAGYPRAGAISPDGRTIACGNAPDTRLIELVSGQFRHRFPVQSHALAFTPDNRFLVTAAADAPGYVWDIRGSLARPLAPENWDRVWKDLVGDDAEAAFQAIRSIAAHPKSGTPFLRKRVAERPSLSAEKFIALMNGLKSEQFTERERSTEELGKCAELAEPGVLKAMDTDPSPELHKRANQALKAAEPRFLGERRWTVRIVEAIEWSGTQDSRELLIEWSRGAAHSRLTVESVAALRRLEVPNR